MKRQITLTITLAAIGAVAAAGAVSYFSFLQPVPCGSIDPNDRPNSSMGIVRPIYVKSWKLSNDKGHVDWNPLDKNMFLVGTDVYCADGSLLFSIANDTHTEWFSNERFSPDGSSIAYLYRAATANYTIYSPLSQIQIFDIKNKSIESIDVAENISDYDWGEDSGVIFYTTGSHIIKHDISSRTESTVANASSQGRILGIDVSHDGKSLLFTEVIPTSLPGECNDMFGQCFNIQLVARPLTNTSSDSDGSELIYQGTTNTINYPRWTPDGSAITFSTNPSFVLAGFPCGRIIEITRDGQSVVTLFPGNEIYGKRACYNHNLAFNKDQTLVAYTKILGYYPVEPDDFQPQNEGTYLTFTELCNQSDCRAPSKTIPIVKG